MTYSTFRLIFTTFITFREKKFQENESVYVKPVSMIFIFLFCHN